MAATVAGAFSVTNPVRSEERWAVERSG